MLLNIEDIIRYGRLMSYIRLHLVSELINTLYTIRFLPDGGRIQRTKSKDS